MDNLSIHQSARVRQAIEAKGCQLLFLPAYSPDLSPIEEAFSKLKTYLRRVGARTHEALFEAIADALLTVTAADACSWFTHCGYQTPIPPEPASLLRYGGAYRSMILYTALGNEKGTRERVHLLLCRSLGLSILFLPSVFFLLIQVRVLGHSP